MDKINNMVDKSLDLYANNLVIRGLAETIKILNPALSIADGVLLSSINNLQQKRMKAFFDELESGNINLSEEIIKSDDFLHKYMITRNVVVKTNRKEKIKIFAMLFKSSINNKGDFAVDLYEEYLDILDELSYRELYILAKLYKYENEYPLEPNENELQRCNKFWNEFTNEIKNDLNIDEEELDAILTRINRTGCYKEIVGTYVDYNGGKGKLTPIFNRIQKLINSEY
ncbi:Uncharacterised protein [[Clostridium] sordellii]|uniref:Uncharacterized protein n=1 Tax=Paraclostridium sordellii TaxID=1505 RepID=A0ABM9RQB1_PARSO|nr:hypothetical protein [Paeniclostridium sordellii]CEJ74240.1 hypothetical protein ATCC9714_21281 [[Clostridium] sordellii] [Paeniclostridium sordellii]CEN69782.1 Uncharacterised protein [[Clostridium] sordellii] [Paeniclostridium sordellii]CEN73050.1 Uncharacterised protein [[Clostridium] sordellii] [Paeniclostridium sordellii]CEO25639.1 Uncharacterised protein [[Clostridium] sordellii] [Paeniclostridium sordellii]CEP75357.1 Uncharacterised protein [[Clostridium] sordellii] [Paeniclostridium